MLLGKGGPSGTHKKFLLILLRSVKMTLLLRIQMIAAKMEVISLLRTSLMIMESELVNLQISNLMPSCTKAVLNARRNALTG